MTDAWYYAEGDKSIGPITLADLIVILSRVSDGQSLFVWGDGLANWVQAKNLPELAPHVTKPPPFRRAVSEPTWQRTLSVWWLLCWRGLIGGAIIGAIVDLILLLIGGLVGVKDETVQFTSTVVGTLLGFVWVIVVVQMALRKRYRHFRLALIPHAPDRSKAQELEPTWQRALSVWWLIVWRSFAGWIIWVGVLVIFAAAEDIIGLRETRIPPFIGFTMAIAAGLAVGFVLLIVVLKMALRKRYRHFRIAVIPLTPASA